MKTIPLTQGLVAIVDDEDYPELSKYKWCAARFHNRGTYYALRSDRSTGKNLQVCMHRQILGLEHGDPRQGDHVNRNGLDNRRENLRIATNAENGRNRPVQANNTTGLKGVGWNKQHRKYHAQIKVDGKKIHLGLFASPIAAARAYDAAARKYFGEFARPNFQEAT